MRIVVGKYPFLEALRTESHIGDFPVQFDDSYSPIHDAFNVVCDSDRFDIGELALATYIQARAAGRALTILPVTLVARFQHANLVVRENSTLSDPGELVGRRVGVRAYSQTTGVWVRSFMRTQYGVDCSEIEWVTIEPPHLRDFAETEPPNVHRAPQGSGLGELLSAGEIDGVVGVGVVDGTRPLLASPGIAAREWFLENGFVPLNHILVVREETLEKTPKLVHQLYVRFMHAISEREIEPSRHNGDADEWSWTKSIEFLPVQPAGMVHAVRKIADEVHRQQLIPTPVSDNDLFNEQVVDW